MKAGFAIASECDHSSETFAAELTEAVFPVALRYGVRNLWIDLELDLWRVLAETVKAWSWEAPADASPGEIAVWRKGFLAELANAAYRTALRHGTRGSIPQARAGLHQAFRSVIGETVRNCGRVPA